MTQERANDIERIVIYKHIDNIMRDLEDCDNSNVVFNVGRRLGMLQYDLQQELKKELKEQNK